tara:strand:+ start:140 stop:1441 length:1302 start_codon:yes stop_codon:yes gene_type:complete
MTAKSEDNAYNTWSITSAAKAIAAGDLTSEALVASCLARIEEREAEVGAWIHIDAERALAEARQRDAATPGSPLHGIPFGIKDIIDTVDMPTGYGSPIYKDAQPLWDASCVALLREAGCVALGKTVTTEFATRHAGKTCNPLDLTRTPGGSSSGSAAAVADFMVPVAYGTQTTGSVIRPGAYCGVVAVKPTFGLINRAGVKELSESMDTIGFYTRSVEDAALFLHVLADYPQTDFGDVETLKPKIAICRTTVWDQANSETVALFDSLTERFGKLGAEVRELELPADFDDIAPAQAVLNDYESLRALAYERINFPDQLSEEMTSKIERSLTHSRDKHSWAIDLMQHCKTLLPTLLAEDEVIVAPAAQGIAEVGHVYTGDPIFSQVWNAIHVPSVCVPAGTGPAGMPLGIQIIARCREDDRAFIHAEWVRRALAG